jgi:hypothetical protein
MGSPPRGGLAVCLSPTWPCCPVSPTYTWGSWRQPLRLRVRPGPHPLRAHVTRCACVSLCFRFPCAFSRCLGKGLTAEFGGRGVGGGSRRSRVTVAALSESHCPMRTFRSRCAQLSAGGAPGSALPGPEITFLFTAVAGCASRSYGLNVARLAGLPPSVLRSAEAKSAAVEFVRTTPAQE